MQLIEIFAREVKPIKLAHISDMSDTVVLAGPNGVGKTRLISGLLHYVQNLRVDPNFYIRVRATCDAERDAWKKPELDTRINSDVALLRATLQKRHRRTNLTSSFLNFESNRTIQQVRPYNWDWNFGDPFLEEVEWNFGFGNMTNRFQDMLHSIFRKIRSRREAIALRYEAQMKQREDDLRGNAESPEERARRLREHIPIDPVQFPDALMPFKRAFSQLLAPKELLDPEIQNQQLSYRTVQGDKLAITELSSGEREVVTRCTKGNGSRTRVLRRGVTDGSVFPRGGWQYRYYAEWV
ncbi:MAG: hypothetical protein WBB34_10735 [Xanthobacteraceae bacterium]